MLGAVAGQHVEVVAVQVEGVVGLIQVVQHDVDPCGGSGRGADEGDELVVVPVGAREGGKGQQLRDPGGAVHEARGLVAENGEDFGLGVQEQRLLGGGVGEEW